MNAMNVPNYDDSTAFLGDRGPFQKTVFALLCLSIIPNAFTGLSMVFIGDTPAHRCVIPADLNITAEWRNASVAIDEHDGEARVSRCSRHRVDIIKSYSDRGLIPWVHVNVSAIPQENCLDGWEYDRRTYISTIVSEWDLVCSDDWRAPLTTSLFFCGVLTGSVISGQLSDRFGRKIVLFVTMGIQTVFTFIQVFSPSWLIFCLLFFIVGMGQISNYVAAFVLGMEILSASVRDIYSTLGVCIFFSIGYMTLPLAAYFLRDWRTLLLALTIPGFFYIPLWWFIPESPRWLLSQGRVEEADEILRKAAKMNGVKAPDVIFPQLQSVEKTGRLQTYSLCDLVKSTNIRCITLLLCLVWSSVSIGYCALSLNTSNLHGNIYLNCFLSAVVEVPALILAWLMFRCWSRRLCLSTTLSLGGLVLLFIHLIPQNMNSVAISLVLLGKFGLSAAFAIVYPATAELYPTVLRNTALGACSMASRVGSISAPYFVYLGGYYKSLPYILIGSLSVFSGLLSLLLPESLGMPLPEAISHMQKISGCCKIRHSSNNPTNNKCEEERESVKIKDFS
ncbi:solute carrier family 22 member 4-like isoform X1 [Triplophysa rosa]|uniref:solute carrier family 22 member 4-like isoform X1 n=1 Tax=Triplophysa rosa TaxID=992332 RepID=UPI002545D8F4|nr:solute carrier family 22 member 4-like isoform X1 [Triplophysa rosa]